MTDWSKNRGFMSWTFRLNDRMFQVLDEYGYKISQMGIFAVKVDINGDFTIDDYHINRIKPYVDKWTHINWLITIRNDGTRSIFEALINNTNGAKDNFLLNLQNLIDSYDWIDGIDIDLERGGAEGNQDNAVILFSDIYSIVHNNNNLHMHVDFPGLTAPNTSLGGEYWCNYEVFEPYFDTVTIMTYGFAWNGSSPGAVSPTSWLDDVYKYVSESITLNKVYMGLAFYGVRWQLYKEPPSDGYRGVSLNYYACKNWLNAVYNHTGDTLPQPFIPFVAYWNWQDMCPYSLLHVYDYLEAVDYEKIDYPMYQLEYKNKPYFVTYGKQQLDKSTGVIVEKTGTSYNSISGFSIGTNFVSPSSSTGEAVYTFNVSSSGTYSILVRVNFQWFNKSRLNISVDGNYQTISAKTFWYPYNRKVHYILHSTKSLSVGNHTITVNCSGSDIGTQFWGFKVCSNADLKHYGGMANYKTKLRKFKDINGNMVKPATGFILTSEHLRRVPDSALVWYEYWRNYSNIPLNFYIIHSGNWSIYNNYLYGSGDISLNFDNFNELHVVARISLIGANNAGIYLGKLYISLDYSNQRIAIYKDSTLIGQYSKSISKNISYQIGFRSRGTNLRIYSGLTNTLIKQISIDTNDDVGYCGIRSDGSISSSLFRLGDAWYYEPYEKYTVKLPNGTYETYGRISRTNITWHNDFEYFKVNSDIEESNTRTETISLDYDFYHSSIMNIDVDNDYEIEVICDDINVWISTLYIGDKDGFSIMYYADARNYLHWANRSAYDYKFYGCSGWSLGQEDLKLWKLMPDIVPN